jgi:acetyl-CoA C-acetyltransferase
VASAVAGVAPSLFGLGPVPAIEKLLARTGLQLADIDAIEINEAFAAQAVACERRLGIDRDVLNTEGGAIALGHPLGSSGSRLLITLMGRLERTGGRYGIASLCIGVGQGAAMLVERVN